MVTKPLIRRDDSCIRSVSHFSMANLLWLLHVTTCYYLLLLSSDDPMGYSSYNYGYPFMISVIWRTPTRTGLEFAFPQSNGDVFRLHRTGELGLSALRSPRRPPFPATDLGDFVGTPGGGRRRPVEMLGRS